MLLDIASFDLLPDDSMNDKILGLNENSTKPYNQWFDEMGFNTTRVILNVGSSFYYLIITIFMVFVYAIIKNFKNSPRCVKAAEFLRKKLFWGQFLRLMIEGYIDITLSCLINI